MYGRSHLSLCGNHEINKIFMETSYNANNNVDQKLTGFFRSLLFDAVLPAIPENASAELRELVDYVAALRQILASFSTGNIDQPINIRGYTGGHLKALQANLRHLTWQARMVAQGDLRQRVSFMGEFSKAFNEMVETLDRNMHDLASARDQLAVLNEALLDKIKHQEIDQQNLKRSENHFRQLAITDTLTQALSRQHFFTTATEQMARIIKTKGHGCLLMLDADHFKTINDTHGHLAGDQVLRALADTFHTALRSHDLLARYGGEEFVVLLPKASRAEGMQVAERLRQAVERMTVQTVSGDIQVTVSIGVTFISAEGPVKYHPKQAEALLLAMVSVADQALYNAKGDGRNRVIFGGSQEGDYSQLLQN